MFSFPFSLKIAGIDNALLGYGLTPLKVPGDAFIILQETNRLRAFGLAELSIGFNIKTITAYWPEIEILLAQGPLKPLPEYFLDDETGRIKPEYTMKLVKIWPSKSYGKHPLMPTEYKLDLYARSKTNQGDDKMDAVVPEVLAVFFEDHLNKHYAAKLDGLTIRCRNAQGNWVQPVTFKVSYPDHETVTVTPFDGVASFQYSFDRNTWTADPVLTKTSENQNTIYVKDAAGTINSLGLNFPTPPSE